MGAWADEKLREQTRRQEAARKEKLRREDDNSFEAGYNAAIHAAVNALRARDTDGDPVAIVCALLTE